MIKAELIEKIAKDEKLSKAAANRIVNNITTTIAQTLKSGGKVVIAGFGTFKVRNRKGKKGVNPATGQPITIPAHRSAAFVPGKPLRKLVK